MKKTAIIGLFILLSACSWRSPNAEFYVMNSQGLSEISARKLNIAVARVKVPDMLDRAQMVVYDKDSDKVNILEFNRWVEVLPDILQSTITNDLIAYLPNAYIKNTYFDSTQMQYSVNVEINRIAAYTGDKVILSAWWNITNAGGYVLRREQVSYEIKVKGDSISDLVEAQSEAVHQLSKAIAEQLAKM